MVTGLVKFFARDRGYGFIKPDDGGPDVFLHASALEQAGIRNLLEGARISFDVAIDQRKSKTNAQNVKLLCCASALLNEVATAAPMRARPAYDRASGRAVTNLACLKWVANEIGVTWRRRP
jgi:CspA family cold shock protein